tara:strand:+ start:1032 stop:1832 length:801 start_codon:yes stop_codon:yes gene_type:complete
MRVIFLGKNSEGNGGFCKGIAALQYLLDCQCEVVSVVACDETLKNFAYGKNLALKEIEEIYNDIDNGEIQNIDFVISYGYMRRIRQPLIGFSQLGCINFHPAPLPDWRGMGGVFNFALFEEVKEWGVTAHLVDKSFDTGDILKVNYFDVDASRETVASLVQKSHEQLYILYRAIVDSLINSSIDMSPRKQGKGRYISRKDFNILRKIQTTDSLETIDKKIKAFFYPPRHGAFIEIQGKEYTLVNDEMLKKIKIIIEKEEKDGRNIF